MLGEILNKISISESVIQLVFESENTIDVYGKLIFRDLTDIVISKVDVNNAKSITIPHGYFLGKEIVKEEKNPGSLKLYFPSAGVIEIIRSGSEPEIGLICTGTDIEVLM